MRTEKKLDKELFEEDIKELKELFESDVKKIEEEIKDEKEKRRRLQKVRRAFLKKRQGLIFKKEQIVEELQEYVVFLMKNNGHTDILEGVQAGEFYMKSADGKQEKSIMLTANKLTTINYNGQYFKGWVVHEDNMSPYPQDPIHNAETYRKTTQKLAMNYRDVNEAKFIEAKTKMWITVAVVAFIIIYIVYVMAKNGNWFGAKEVASGAVETAKETITNNTVGVRAGG